MSLKESLLLLRLNILFREILGSSIEDSRLIIILDKILRSESRRSTIESEGVLRFDGCICVPRVGH